MEMDSANVDPGTSQTLKVASEDIPDDNDLITKFQYFLTPNFASEIIVVSSSITYVGETLKAYDRAAAQWRVVKIETVGNITKVLRAGTGKFDQVLDDYLTLDYA
jgi:hypothetical protein